MNYRKIGRKYAVVLDDSFAGYEIVVEDKNYRIQAVNINRGVNVVTSNDKVIRLSGATPIRITTYNRIYVLGSNYKIEEIEDE